MWTSLEVVGWPSDPVLLGAFPLADGHTGLFGSNLTGREGPVSCYSSSGKSGDPARLGSVFPFLFGRFFGAPPGPGASRDL